MRILLLGKDGQLGWELQRTLPALAEVVAWGRSQVDLSDLVALRQTISSCTWDILVNAAAYTAVDQAEVEIELAKKINADAPQVMAGEAKKKNAVFIHFSTDYVFDGQKREPYNETDHPNPINHYGKTKLAGERAILETGSAFFVFRTSWVYSLRGENFVTRMIKWAQQRKDLLAVTDQTGCPTWSRMLAEFTSLAICKMKHLGREWTVAQSGVYHLASLDFANRFDIACYIVQLLGLPARVKPTLTQEFPSLANRPYFSALSSSHFCQVFDLHIPTWREMLELSLESNYTHVSCL